MTDDQTDAALRIATELFRQLDDLDRFRILQMMNERAADDAPRCGGQIIDLTQYRREK